MLRRLLLRRTPRGDTVYAVERCTAGGHATFDFPRVGRCESRKCAIEPLRAVVRGQAPILPVAGESECCWYHALEEGFSARKPIADSIRHRLLN